MSDNEMTPEEAREFAEATFLDVLRGDLGDFRLTIVRQDGRYAIQMRVEDSEPAETMEGDSFAEAWLSAYRVGEQRGHLGVIKGGKD